MIYNLVVEKKNMIVRLVLACCVSFGILSNANAEDLSPSNPAYLSETLECEFTPELKALAEKLEHDPLKIFKFCHDNIEHQRYEHSRKDAQSVLWTRQGNSLDQATLLITLFRISGIPSRYLNFYNTCYVQAYLPSANYRGVGAGSDKRWVNISSSLKEMRLVQEGIDVFPDHVIPPSVAFDPEEYLSEVRTETSVDVFEQNLQNYLEQNFPGKSLKDVRKIEEIVPFSLGTFPEYAKASGDIFSAIPGNLRVVQKLEVHHKSTGKVLISKEIPLSQISSKNLTIGYVAADNASQSKINAAGHVSRVADGAAQVYVAYKLNGNVIEQSNTKIAIGDELHPHYRLRSGEMNKRSAWPAGTIWLFGADHLSGGIGRQKSLIERIKLINSRSLNPEILDEYIRLSAELIYNTYSLRLTNNALRVYELTGFSHGYSASASSPHLVYTNAKNIQYSDVSALFQVLTWNIDAMLGSPAIGKNGVPSYDEPIFQQIRDTYMYAGSYNEGRVFEDWVGVPGLNTIKVFMLAKEFNIPIVTIKKQDIQNGDIPILTSQPKNVYSSGVIRLVVETLSSGDSEVSMPVQLVPYFDKLALGMRTITPQSNGYLFTTFDKTPDNGGGMVDAPEAVEEAEASLGSILGDLFSGIFNAVAGIVDAAASVISGITDFMSDFASSISEAFNGDDQFEKVEDNKPEAKRELVGDPVDLVRGEFVVNELPDILIKGRGWDLSVVRNYRSQMIYDGPFGYGWNWNHGQHLFFKKSNEIVYYDEDHTPYLIKIKSNGGYTYPEGVTWKLTQNSSGFKITFKDKKVFEFNNFGQLTKKVDAFGNTLSFGYNGNRQLTTMTDAVGRSLTFAYFNNGKVNTITDFTGRRVSYAYSGSDLIRYADLEGNLTKYEYLKNQDNQLNNHNMSKYILPNGDFLNLSYYKNDRVASHTNTLGDTFMFQYSTFNKYGETWNEAGYYRKVFWDDNLNVTKIITEEGTLENKAYDANHNMIKYTDPQGGQWTYTYDGRRNRLTETNPLGHTVRYEYHSTLNKITKKTDAKGNVTTFTYNSAGAITKKVDALGNETNYTYDGFGNLKTVTDALGHTESYAHDGNNLYQTKFTDKNGHETSYSYNAVGQLATQTTPAGNATNFTYTAYGQKKTVTDPRGGVASYNYNVNGQLASETAPNGATITYAYHPARDVVEGGKLKSRTDAFGNVESYEYDKLGNRTKKTDALGHVTRYEYDHVSRLIETVDAMGKSVTRKYDANGNLLALTDKRGNTTKHAYDKANRKIQTIAPRWLDRVGSNFEVITSYEYDANGNITKKLDRQSHRTYDENGAETIHEDLVGGHVTSYTYDKLNRITSTTTGVGTADERTVSTTFDAVGRKVRITNDLGHYTQTVYDDAGNVLEVQNYDSTGTLLRKVVNTYTNENRLNTSTDANGNLTTYEYDAGGNRTAVIDAANNRVENDYDSRGWVTASRDAAGHETRTEYDLLGRVLKVTNALGHHTTFTYDAMGRVSRSTDAEGHTTHHFYDALGRKIATRDALGNRTEVQYDANGNVVAHIDAAGQKTSFEYDEHNNKTKTISPLGHETKYYYDNYDRQTSVSDAKNQSTSTTYNIHGQVIKVKAADDAVTTQDYDSLGRLIRTTNPRGTKTEYTYDALNRRITTKVAVGTALETITSFEYDAVGNKTAEVNALGQRSEYVYNNLNQLVTATQKGDAELADRSTTYEYDVRGLRTKATDPRGNHVQTEYDALGRVVKTIDQAAGESTIAYSKRGEVILTKDPEGIEVVTAYDALGRVIRKSQDNRETSYEYNVLGQVTAEINYNRVRSEFSYDEDGRRTGVKKAVGTADETFTQYEYDSLGQNTRIIDARGKRYVYTYDKRGRVTQKFYEAVLGSEKDAQVKHVYGYDLAGNRIFEAVHDGNGTVHRTIDRHFDELNRVTRVDADGVQQQSFTYDALSRIEAATDLNSGTKTHNLTYEYDVFGQVTAEVQDGHRIEKGYDANGNKTSIDLTNGQTVARTYDARNYPQSASLAGVADVSFGFNGTGRLTSMSQGTSVGYTATYNKRNQETLRRYTINTDTKVQITSNYDNQGNITAEAGFNHAVDVGKTYAYDKLDRLKSETRGASTAKTWKYDKVGNWTFTNQNGVDEDRSVNFQNQYAGYDYDAFGNMTNDGRNTYTYDWQNRLSSVKTIGGITIATYTYDAMNRRRTKTLASDGSVRDFIYDGSRITEEHLNGVHERTYLYGAYVDEVVAMVKGGQTHYVLRDRQYNVIGLTAADGSLLERYEYSSFGLRTVFDASGNEIANSAVGFTIGFTGRWFDEESGLWHYRNRIYNPVAGRFMQEDPAGFVDGMNYYAYVRNNPLFWVDPSGFKAKSLDSHNKFIKDFFMDVNPGNVIDQLKKNPEGGWDVFDSQGNYKGWRPSLPDGEDDRMHDDEYKNDDEGLLGSSVSERDRQLILSSFSQHGSDRYGTNFINISSVDGKYGDTLYTDGITSDNCQLTTICHGNSYSVSPVGPTNMHGGAAMTFGGVKDFTALRDTAADETFVTGATFLTPGVGVAAASTGALIKQAGINAATYTAYNAAFQTATTEGYTPSLKSVGTDFVTFAAGHIGGHFVGKGVQAVGSKIVSTFAAPAPKSTSQFFAPSIGTSPVTSASKTSGNVAGQPYFHQGTGRWHMAVEGPYPGPMIKTPKYVHADGSVTSLYPGKPMVGKPLAPAGDLVETISASPHAKTPSNYQRIMEDRALASPVSADDPVGAIGAGLDALRVIYEKMNSGK